MATTTPRIGLTKPDGTDLVDIAVLNTNFDKIDSNIASTKIQSTKPTTANAGDLWWDSDTGTLYLYYTDANSSQWVAATSDPINIGVVANQTERDAQYPTPAQGMSVYRTDLGYTQRYYGLYNASTNPAGRNPAGWYKEAGMIVQMVYGTTISEVTNSTSSFIDTGLTATITPTSTTSKIIVLVTQNGLFKSDGGSTNAVWLHLMINGTAREVFGYAVGLNYVTGNVFIGGASTVYVDSPGTTSAITYKTQFRNEASGASVSVQKSSNARSNIILIEVASA